MRPYWQSDDGAITVYHARFEDVLAAGVVDVPRVALVHDDPPYGIRLDTKARISKTPKPRGGCKPREYLPVVGDDKPFDPAPLLARGAIVVAGEAGAWEELLGAFSPTALPGTPGPDPEPGTP